MPASLSEMNKNRYKFSIDDSTEEVIVVDKKLNTETRYKIEKETKHRLRADLGPNARFAVHLMQLYKVNRLRKLEDRV